MGAGRTVSWVYRQPALPWKEVRTVVPLRGHKKSFSWTWRFRTPGCNQSQNRTSTSLWCLWCLWWRWPTPVLLLCGCACSEYMTKGTNQLQGAPVLNTLGMERLLLPNSTSRFISDKNMDACSCSYWGSNQVPSWWESNIPTLATKLINLLFLKCSSWSSLLIQLILYNRMIPVFSSLYPLG